MVAEIDPARRLQAAYDGWHVVDLREAIASADVVATATGGKNVVNRRALTGRKREYLSLTSATWRKRSTASTCASTPGKR